MKPGKLLAILIKGIMRNAKKMDYFLNRLFPRGII